MFTLTSPTHIDGLAVVAFWRSPHGPLGSGLPTQRIKRKEKGEKGKRKKEKKKERERKEKEKERRRKGRKLKPIWVGYSVSRLCTSLYTRPLISQSGESRPTHNGHRVRATEDWDGSFSSLTIPNKTARH